MDFESTWLEIKKGNERAFGELFKETGSSLYYFAYQLVNDEVKSEEIVHDVFLNIWEKRSYIIIYGSLKSYLYKSVHNQAINWLIQQKTARVSSSVLIPDEAWQKLLNTCECNGYLIETLEAVETWNMIQKIIEDLPDQCREIFCLSRFESKSNKEISEKLAISSNTVRTQIFRALKKIQDGLQKKSK
jgi:RNA polymerase sigma-70 factor, ECF subfamily